MNERIKELAVEAASTIDTTRGNHYVSHPDFNKKFAELMVKKFDDILVLEYLDCVGNKDKPAAERIERLREKVKTYFGVEE